MRFSRRCVPRSHAGQLDYNTTRASLCQHLFSIFSTNFSPPFWALCILLSAARRTTRGGFLGGRRGWAAAARCFHCPQRSWLRERSPGGLQAAPTSNGKSGSLSETPRLPERSCGGVQTPPYKPTEDPNDPQNHDHKAVRGNPQQFQAKTTNCIFVIIWESLGPAGQTCKGFTCGLAAEGLYW